MLTLRWHDVTVIDSQLLMQAIDLYERFFRLELREPREVLTLGIVKNDALQPNAFHFLVGVEREEHDKSNAPRVVALSTAHYLADVNIGFIVYLLVEPACQNTGLGSQLLSEMERLITLDAKAAHASPLRGMILETERAEDAHTDDERIDCERRARFFNRNGYHVLPGVFYLQPPLQKTTAAVPLHLFAKGCSGSPAFSGDEVRRIVHAMYRDKYRRINGIDMSVLNECEARLQVPASPPAF